MITHGNIASNAKALHAYWGFVPGDVLLHALPIFHVHGLFVALHTALLNASHILWMPKFELATFMRLLPRATVIMGVPTFYTRLLGDPAFGKDQCRKLRLAISGSAPLLAETHKEFRARTGQAILERYGMTEAGMITSNPYQGGRRLAGTVGYALPGVTVRIADSEGRVLPPGKVGVLEVKGPNVFKGYWRNPEKTKEEFRKGYFVSGDLAKHGQGRPRHHRRPRQGPDHHRRLQRLSHRGRGRDQQPAGHRRVGRGRRAASRLRRGHHRRGHRRARQARRRARPRSSARWRSASPSSSCPSACSWPSDLPRNAMGKVQKANLSKQYRETFKA